MKKRVVSLLMAVVMLCAFVVPASAASVTDFKDVSKNDWFYDAVDYAVTKGLFEGTNDNTFSPEAPMTRAMFVTVLSRKSNVTIDYQADMKFTDVPRGQWYSNAIAWAAYFDIVSGVSDTQFNPNGFVTREQMATILYRYAQKTENNTEFNDFEYSKFPDKGSVSTYAVNAMQWATKNKVINGSGGKLLPSGKATRAQVATIFMNSDELLIKTEVKKEQEPEPEDNTEDITLYACGYELKIGESKSSVLARLPEPVETLIDIGNYRSLGERYYFADNTRNVFFVQIWNDKVTAIAACSTDMKMTGYKPVSNPEGNWRFDSSFVKYKGDKDRLVIGSVKTSDMYAGGSGHFGIYVYDAYNMAEHFTEYFPSPTENNYLNYCNLQGVGGINSSSLAYALKED